MLNLLLNYLMIVIISNSVLTIKTNVAHNINKSILHIMIRMVLDRGILIIYVPIVFKYHD